MIPIIYESNETSFTSNGLGRLRDCIEATVFEERNGLYELDFSYPVDGANYDLIQCGRIVGVTHDDTGDIQPFDIVSFKRPIDGVVEFHCVHISYRQSGLVAYGKNIHSLADAFNMLKTASPSNPFKYIAKFSSNNYMASADGIPKSVRQYLGGVEGSVLDAYGGEYEWDKFNVILHRNRGKARDLVIRYGLNMLKYNEEVDYQDTFTSAIPYWKGDDGAGGEKIIIASKVKSGFAPYDGREKVAALDLTDKFEVAPTKANLRTTAQKLMQRNQSYMPSQNISVDFVRLQDLGEFEQFESLLKCSLCDTIGVVFPQYNMSGRFKIVKTEWDVLANKFNSMELGDLQTTLSEALGLNQSNTVAEQMQAVQKGESGTYEIASSTSFGDTGLEATLTPGYYIMSASISFPAGTGRRGLRWYYGGDTNWSESAVSQDAVSGVNTRMQVTRIMKVNNGVTMKIQAFQNSGGALSCDVSYRYLKLI
jgi:phage minor structural protein